MTMLATTALLLTAACGDSTDASAPATTEATQEASAEPEPTSEATTAAEPAAEETEDAGATVQQWASLVAEGASSVRDAHATWEDENGCLPGDEDFVCTTGMLTMSLTASTLATLLEAGTNVGAPGYIGDPPAEVAGLVEDTRTAATQAADAADAAADACMDGSEECLSLGMVMSIEYGRLLQQLDAWGPYGVAGR